MERARKGQEVLKIQKEREVPTREKGVFFQTLTNKKSLNIPRSGESPRIVRRERYKKRRRAPYHWTDGLGGMKVWGQLFFGVNPPLGAQVEAHMGLNKRTIKKTKSFFFNSQES